MPEISRFPGIMIAMYYNDHVPPHFHTRYGDNFKAGGQLMPNNSQAKQVFQIIAG